MQWNTFIDTTALSPTSIREDATIFNFLSPSLISTCSTFTILYYCINRSLQSSSIKERKFKNPSHTFAILVNRSIDQSLHYTINSNASGSLSVLSLQSNWLQKTYTYCTTCAYIMYICHALCNALCVGCNRREVCLLLLPISM